LLLCFSVFGSNEDVFTSTSKPVFAYEQKDPSNGPNNSIGNVTLENTPFTFKVTNAQLESQMVDCTAKNDDLLFVVPCGNFYVGVTAANIEAFIKTLLNCVKKNDRCSISGQTINSQEASNALISIARIDCIGIESGIPTLQKGLDFLWENRRHFCNLDSNHVSELFSVKEVVGK
jgi:hypothetical protein